MSEARRTPGPWLEDDGVLKGLDGVTVLTYGLKFASTSYRHAVGEANAAFVLEACNNYERVCTERDEVAKALCAVIDGWDDWANRGRIESAIEAARTALAKVKP